MDPEALVHDISSDEEDENQGGGGGDDYDWISELLDEVDRQTTDGDGDGDGDGDDDDDVVVVDEKAVLNLNPKQRLKSSSVKDLDDDCVILDGDPDKPNEVQNNPVGESDDLLVVSEKGQVACRDYPHARHLCAKFPFNSSPHESHCDQCHCYVCDSRVPCAHWGTGISSFDHCHATDKDEFWVLQRKSTRNGDNQSPKPILDSPNDFSLSTRQQQISQVPPSTLIEPNYVDQVCRPMPVHSNTNFNLPNIINPNRNHRSGGYVVPRNKFQTSLVLHQRPNGYSSLNPRDRRHGVGNLGPQSISPRSVFKRSGSFGSSTITNRCVYSSSNNTYRSQFSRSPSFPVSMPVEQDPSRWQDFNSCNVTPEPSSCWTNQDPYQPRVPCQPNSGFEFVNSVPPLQPHASSLPSVVGCYVSAVPSETNAGPVYGNLQVPLEPYMSAGVVENSVPSHPQVYSQPVSVSSDSQNIFHLENQRQGGPSYPSFEFDFSWVNPSSQVNRTPVAENSVLEGAAQMDEPSLPMVDEQQQFPNPNPASLGFQYDSWILDNHPVSGSGLNALSPEPAPTDGGIFFDF